MTNAARRPRISPSSAERRFANAWRFELAKRSPMFRHVFARDLGICWLCQKPVHPGVRPRSDGFGTLDHVVPESLGGNGGVDNLKLAHRKCNQDRGNRQPFQSGEDSQ